MFLACLPWYDLREIAPATDALWRRVAQEMNARGVADAPPALRRDVHYQQQWQDSRFLFGQACGYDVLISYAECLQLVATPRYTAPGCSDGKYSSYVVVREDSPAEELRDLRGSRCVINTPTSHSGMNILRALVAPLHEQGKFFSEVIVSGSHQTSLNMILRGQADVAAIDCVTYTLLMQHRPQSLSATRVLFQTRQVPAPPYVTSAATSPELLHHLRDSLVTTLEDPEMAWVKQELLLDHVDFFTLDDYQQIGELEQMAHDYGYQEFHAHLQNPAEPVR